MFLMASNGVGMALLWLSYGGAIREVSFVSLIAKAKEALGNS
jgi:hypothetical protein